MNLHFRHYGAGKPLIILHGFMGSGENWHTLSRRYFSTRFSVFTPDLRNHGRSPHHPEMNYEVLAEDVRRFMHRRGLDRVFILGHSMGGKVAMQLAMQYPQTVERLIVVDMAPRAYPQQHASILEALSDLDLAAVTSRKQAGQMLAPHIPDTVIRQFLLKNLAFDRATHRYHWRINLPILHQHYGRIVEAVTGAVSYEGPTCFIRGGRSGYITDADWLPIQNQFPAAELVTIPDAGHWVHAEVPEAFVEAIEQFIEDKQWVI